MRARTALVAIAFSIIMIGPIMGDPSYEKLLVAPLYVQAKTEFREMVLGLLENVAIASPPPKIDSDIVPRRPV